LLFWEKPEDFSGVDTHIAQVADTVR